jgi:ribonuclease Z
VAFIKEADLFICEGMYLETSYLDQVKKYKHMLGTEAAYLAQRGKVKQLWLTHFSPAVPNSYIDMKAVKEVFENAVAGVDRKMVTLGFEE